MIYLSPLSIFFFFNDTATTEIYTLSLHDALPISSISSRMSPTNHEACRSRSRSLAACSSIPGCGFRQLQRMARSEEHTSELQSLAYLVCRLLLEKKKKMTCQFIHQHVILV